MKADNPFKRIKQRILRLSLSYRLGAVLLKFLDVASAEFSGRLMNLFLDESDGGIQLEALGRERAGGEGKQERKERDSMSCWIKVFR